MVTVLKMWQMVGTLQEWMEKKKNNIDDQVSITINKWNMSVFDPVLYLQY